MKKILLYLPFIISSVFVSSCACHEDIALADLLSSPRRISIAGSDSIITGQPYDFTMIIVNRSAKQTSKKGCSTITEATPATLFQANLIRDGIIVLEGTKDMPGLAPDASTKITRSILFEQPGTYTLEYILDYPNLVNERNEANNDCWYGKSPNPDIRLEEVRKTNNYCKINFKVSGNSDYHPKDLSIFAEFND